MAAVISAAMSYPTDSEIRAALLQRATAYARITGVALSWVPKAAVNDTKFLRDAANGRDLTVSRYQRAQDWLDAHWPDDKVGLVLRRSILPELSRSPSQARAAMPRPRRRDRHHAPPR